MPIRDDGFDDDIEALTAEIEEDVQKIALAWLQAIMSGTPVDKGFHRNEWHLDFGSVNARIEGSPEQPGNTGARLRIAAQFLEGWTVDRGSIFIHNSGPAIEFLDEGSSQQAPQGILDPATAAIRGRFGLS